MTGAFPTSNNGRTTFILLAICGLLAIAAVTVGIDDNPPGILLAYLAAVAFVLAFAHPWRTARKFLFLLLVSVLGFVLFIIMSITVDSVTQNPATSDWLRNLIQNPVMDAFSLIVVIVCPAAFIIGAVGSVVMYIRNRRQPG